MIIFLELNGSGKGFILPSCLAVLLVFLCGVGAWKASAFFQEYPEPGYGVVCLLGWLSLKRKFDGIQDVEASERTQLDLWQLQQIVRDE